MKPLPIGHVARRSGVAVEAKIRDLEQMRAALRKLVAACAGHGPLAGCSILDALDGTTSEGDAEP